MFAPGWPARPGWSRRRSCAAADHRQALIDGEQIARQSRFVLADQAGDGERFFQFVVGHQRQLDGTGQTAAECCSGCCWMAVDEVFSSRATCARKLRSIDRATLAHFAHAVEVVHLRGVVLGFLGKIEQRVVDVLEHVADVLLQPAGGDATNGIQQLAARARWRGPVAGSD